MVYGESGRYPLEIRVKLKMVSFWTKFVQSQNQLSSILYLDLCYKFIKVKIMILNEYLVSCQFLIKLVLAIFLPIN